MSKIYLHGKYGKGKISLIDDNLYTAINLYKWRLSEDGYVCRFERMKDKSRTIYLHKEVLHTAEGLIDHINRDKLDNRKCNLRICDKYQNAYNKQVRKLSNKYRGVSKAGNKWAVRISVKGKRISLGRFNNEEDAALAYNNAAIKYHGKFALLNDSGLVARALERTAAIFPRDASHITPSNLAEYYLEGGEIPT